MKKNKCCLCGKSFIGFGNNPDPLDTIKGNRCCDDCNRYVIYERIQRSKRGLPMRKNEPDLILKNM